ncbi:DUF559 domain-containing protein [Brachybacterium hainanense]|uniref:DUF559 domain-containing protein n=1 Tax=Brachybacterium hainanense TaxID=1541174 RepID=A0ABV6RDM1_9MICO
MTTTEPELHVRTRRQLIEAGCTSAELAALVADGSIVRLARGWYGSALTPPAVAEALRAGARLTCTSALGLRGVWTPPVHGLHVAVLRAGTRRAAATGMVLHDPALQAWPDGSPVLPVTTALLHAVRCRGTEEAAILLESSLHVGVATMAEVDQLLARLPLRTRSALGTLRADAEAGTETKARRFFEKRHVRVRPQVTIGPWRVDMLVGEKLVIECDSRRYHTGVEDYARTYRKRLDLQARGYTVVNLTYEQVMLDWERTSRMLLGMIRSREHRGEPVPVAPWYR